MKRKALWIAALLVLGASWGSAQATTLRVIMIETADLPAYQAKVAKVNEAMHRLGGKTTLRFWRARFAGPEAGSIVVTLEYPDIVNFAETDAKSAGDAEVQQLLRELAGMRKIVSDSLYEEVK